MLPAVTPVTTPELLTVATDVFDDTHAFDAAGVPEPLRFVVPLIHTLGVPLMVGNAFAVTVNGLEVLVQLLVVVLTV